MKRLLIFTVVGLFLAGSCMARDINTLFGRIPVPMPSETKISLFSNFQVSPYQDFTSSKTAMGFTTEFLRQWDLLYLRGGYSSLDYWLGIAGIDILEGVRKLGFDVEMPEILKLCGVNALNFTCGFDFSGRDNKWFKLGLGTDLFKAEKK